MSNETEFMNALAEAGRPLCDDCLAPAAGWNNRQQADSVGTKLAGKNEISREKGTCAECGKHKLVSELRGGTTNPNAVASPSEPQAASMTPVAASDKSTGERAWYWEGHVQAAIVGHLSSTGWRVTQVIDTASKAQGVDVIAEKNSQELWVTVKGYPKGTSATNPSTQGRHWFSQAMFDVVRYRTERSDIAIGVGLPDGFTTYLNLAPTVAWLHASAPFVFYWASEDGAVREE
jgi:hypothetical protein